MGVYILRKLTKRYIINSLDKLNLSEPIRYERYYINDKLRIQSKNGEFQKEILDDENNIIEKIEISKSEFLSLKETSYSEIIRDSYLFLEEKRVSIKKYLGKYDGLYRVEVTFNTVEEENNYIKESWMGEEITNSPLAFDKNLSKLSENEFSEKLKRFNIEGSIMKLVDFSNKIKNHNEYLSIIKQLENKCKYIEYVLQYDDDSKFIDKFENLIISFKLKNKWWGTKSHKKGKIYKLKVSEDIFKYLRQFENLINYNSYTAFEDEANDIAFLDDEDLPLLYTTTHEGIIMIRDDLLREVKISK